MISFHNYVRGNIGEDITRNCHINQFYIQNGKWPESPPGNGDDFHLEMMKRISGNEDFRLFK